MLRSLATEHEFVVFSVRFENPYPDRIKWVHIPAPLRPLPLLFVSFHLLAPIFYALQRLRTRKKFALVQMVESKLSFGDVAYTHFCHRSYLAKHWRQDRGSGLRGFSRWLDHWLHALLEHRIYHRVKQVLVPSKGLSEELKAEFPIVSNKIRVLPNAVDVETLARPLLFDREGFRRQLQIDPSDVVFVFVALGHFERKGLPLLLDAVSLLESEEAKLLVVGGQPDLVAAYRSLAKNRAMERNVVFAGMQQDIRPYLWASDAFVLASTYETFSLVAFESGAASLPLITTRLYGIEDIVEDGRTGYIVDRNPTGFASAMRKFLSLKAEERITMGNEARRATQSFDEHRFVERWRGFYLEWVERETNSMELSLSNRSEAGEELPPSCEGKSGLTTS